MVGQRLAIVWFGVDNHGRPNLEGLISVVMFLTSSIKPLRVSTGVLHDIWLDPQLRSILHVSPQLINPRMAHGNTFNECSG